MERAKKSRKPVRSALTRTINEIEAEFEKEHPDQSFLQERLTKLDEILYKLDELDSNVLSTMLDDNVGEDEYDDEYRAIEEYQDKSRSAKVKIRELLSSDRANDAALSDFVSAREDKSKTYKLPKIELRKFSGDLRDWLNWWSQFEKLHEDPSLHTTDKFQYLIQATTEGSKVRRLIEGYPQTAENYPKVITALKDRYGDRTLLTELYVRRLAGLVIANARKTKSNSSLATMYDELDSSLRSLESLGVTSEQSAAFLYPLVESSLPEELLKVWQRSSISGYDEEGDNGKGVTDRLHALMKFLKQEVKGEQRLSFVNAGLEVQTESRPRRSKSFHSGSSLPTAAGLLSTEVNKCVFCDRAHESKDCGNASQMSLDAKRRKLEEKRSCFACFKSGHSAKKCRSFVKCVICGKKHFVILCPEVGKIRQEAQKSEPSKLNEEIQHSLASSCSSPTLLQTLRVKLHGPNGVKVVRALIDSGAQKSYILNSTASTLGLESQGEQELSHAVFGGQCTSRKIHNQFHVSVGPLKGSCQETIHVLGQDKICNQLPPIPKGDWMKSLGAMGIQLSDINQMGEVEALFGADTCARIFTGKMVYVNSHIVAIQTKLGWTVMGKVYKEPVTNYGIQVIHSCLSTLDVDQLWRLDTLGIKDPIECKSKEEKDLETQRRFENTLERSSNGRYIVALPWTTGYSELQNNRKIAESRLQRATEKLQSRYELYNSVFTDWLKEELIENVVSKVDSVYYLPHRPVFKDSLTTPVRPVFDASCKSGVKGPSLNDLLERGPNLLEIIPDILCRFRRFKIGVISDIRKAFQMVEVRKEDRDFLRFLWWDENGTVKEFRHRKVVFGVSSSPYLLGAVLNFHLKHVAAEDQQVASKLLSSFYVDNCVTSVETEEEYDNFKTKSTNILRDAQMDLRQWEYTAGEEPGVGLLLGNKCGLGSGSGCISVDPSQDKSMVLGLQWNKKKDTLSCVIKSDDNSEVTKKAILSVMAKLFDPIGFSCPATVLPKMWLQKLWATKLDWNAEVTGEIKNQFLKWKHEQFNIGLIEIPRHAFHGVSTDNFQIHTFCDASQVAYAAVTFVRVQLADSVKLYFLGAKARIAPVKRCTIPRLELMSCLIGSRLYQSFKNAFKLLNIRYIMWTDSSTALAWIKSQGNWGTFVGNRVKEINTTTDVSNWRHIPGAVNPADLLSRGCFPKQLLESRWWEGPSWLLLDENTWPCSTPQFDEALIDVERRKTTAVTTLIAGDSEVPWYAKFSSHMKTLRIIARILRVRKKPLRCNSNITAEEILEARQKLFFMIQQECFPPNATSIDGVRVTVNTNGLYCVVTKLTYREDLDAFKRPILLPANHNCVVQLIRFQHELHNHVGVQFLMGKLRESVWIIRARKTIKSVIQKCIVCQRFQLKPTHVEAAPLPSDRVQPTRPFQVTGVDLAGPLFLKSGQKSWIVLFTCAVYRCVHLELVLSLSTEDFLGAMQKFVCRRGRPETMWSDNGTNFKGASNAFKKLDWVTITSKTQLKEIQWKFIPPSSPWWGGWWERLVRSTKDLLKKMLGHGKVTGPQLESLLCEVEATLNGRPLTYVSDDQDDLVPLTPEAFLHQHPSSQFPETSILDGNALRRKAEDLSKLRKELRDRFRREYLSLLIQRGRGEKKIQLREGDVVLVGSDQTKPLLWPIGRIVKLIPGADGKVRVAKVKVKNNVLTRPLQRLYPLEIHDPRDAPQTVEASENGSNVTRYGRIIKKPVFYEP